MMTTINMTKYNKSLLLKEAEKIGSLPADTPLPKMKGWKPYKGEIIMREVFVIAYYGSIYSKQYHQSWQDVYIGEGIMHESKPLNSYPTPSDNFIEHHAPKDKTYKYAQIEKRFYPEIG